MFNRVIVFVLGLALLLVFAGGCVKNYIVTENLRQPLAGVSSCSVGAILDEMPFDTEESKKPTAEAIQKFKNRLMEHIADQKVFAQAVGTDSALYEITGAVLEYKKGSGALRFFIGFGAGNAKITTNLKLTDLKTGEIVFAGAFKGVVADWAESGDKMFDQVAKDFAKELKNQQKKLLPKKP